MTSDQSLKSKMYFKSDKTLRMIFVAIIFNFCLNHTNGNYNSILPTFMEHFRAPSPLSLHYEGSVNKKINLIKECSHYGLRLNWIDEHINKETFLLILSDNIKISSIGRIEINQQIYFLTPNFNLYERYMINGYFVENILGQFINNTYYPRKNVETNFMKRRNDFHGLKLVGLVEGDQEIDIININDAIYIESNDTYLVTNHVIGSYHDILKTLQNRLNFTTQLYKRRSGGWGAPLVYPNGSIELSDGMIKDVMLGKADLIATSISILYSR